MWDALNHNSDYQYTSVYKITKYKSSTPIIRHKPLLWTKNVLTRGIVNKLVVQHDDQTVVLECPQTVAVFGLFMVVYPDGSYLFSPDPAQLPDDIVVWLNGIEWQRIGNTMWNNPNGEQTQLLYWLIQHGQKGFVINE